ncbi:MAG: quinolinate synthase NadA [Clostridia bacterium]|nr:quinolinate synthase NadA [Clostridia bacterium]
MIQEILRLKKEKNALILAHYYAPLAIWQVADRVGDSLELSRAAAAAEEELIVFCGVRFMAESAKILNPKKKVILPVADAGCPMADMIEEKELARLKAEHPEAAVICYVNSSAAVKALSDICCTSAGALKVAASRPEKEIIFVPDRNLGAFVASHFPEKTFHLIDGHCPIHNACSAADIRRAKELHPAALVAAHPECGEGVSELSDFVGSTSGILDYCKKSKAKEFIIGTEEEIVWALTKACPDKIFHPAKDGFLCADMKKNTPEALYRALETEENEILLDEDTVTAAARALEAMIRL